MTDIRVVVDDNLKKNAEFVLENLDLTISQAVRFFLRELVANQSMPFEMPHQKIFNKTTQAAISRAKKKKNLKSYKNVDEMFKDWDNFLNQDDAPKASHRASRAHNVMRGWSGFSKFGES